MSQKRVRNLTKKTSKESLRWFVAFGMVFIGTIAVISAGHQQANASGSQVVAEICDNSSLPIIAITTPTQGFVVNTASVSLQGTTARTSQIDIYINNAYSTSIAIGLDQTFSTPISLIPGENTIELRGYYSCNQTTQTVSIFGTYNPAVVPGGVSTTVVTPPGQPTITGNNTVSNPGGVYIGSPQPIETPTFAERVQDNLGISKGSGKKNTLFGYDASKLPLSAVNPVFNWLVLLSTLATFGAVIAPLFFVKRLRGVVGISNNRLTSRGRWMVRLISLILTILLVVVLQL